MPQADLAAPIEKTRQRVLQVEKAGPLNVNEHKPPQRKGSRRNPEGDEARADIACLLELMGCHVRQGATIGETIYGTKLQADIVVDPCPRWPSGLAVQVYAQAISGSADQKFPYFVANIKDRFAMPTVIVLVGEGFSARSEEWLLGQVDGERLVAVLTVADFEHWAASVASDRSPPA